MQATLTSKGQITLPKALRTHLNLIPGDRVEFVMDDDGQIRLVPKTTSVRRLKGMLPRPDEPVSLERMEEAIAEGAAQR